MSADFLSYQHVPQGFEIVIGNTDVEMGKIWNLWWNVKLLDDPKVWDKEIKVISKIQEGLHELTRDQRLIRAQMAEFCRVSPLFPESVNILCKEIGLGRLTMPQKLGCEGRNLLESLGYHDAESMKEQTTRSLERYRQGLKRWLSGDSPKNPVDAKVSGFLGEVTGSKEGFVKSILPQMESREYSLADTKEMCEAECRRAMGDSFDTRARPLHCFDCPGSRIGENGLLGCACSHGTLLDVGILCTRINDDWTSVLNEYRRFAEEYILAYALSVNSWLMGSAAKPATSLTTCRYITEEIAKEIPVKVHTSLEKKDDVKMWLAACLLKTLKSNQRWHKRDELIDDFPEATSWLRST